MDANTDRVVPDKYKKLQKEWKVYERIWSSAHYFLGLAATILAFLATTKGTAGTTEDSNLITTYTLLSGVLAVTLTFLSPASRRKAYTESCDLMRIARLRYETEETMTVKDLNDVVQKAQEIIAKR
ncbi:hypothetical protein [Planctobacterium marinum]|uniref:hypothetical protein n=1 Tax=Planctobacterium marinum TaxID=1631968 RepID=UPI001E3B7AF8|nr:hypothetical protein [Planctobacterium marinum]MCC2605029.1 hypothetical protein [Planctobacterium marinum]